MHITLWDVCTRAILDRGSAFSIFRSWKLIHNDDECTPYKRLTSLPPYLPNKSFSCLSASPSIIRSILIYVAAPVGCYIVHWFLLESRFFTSPTSPPICPILRVRDASDIFVAIDHLRKRATVVHNPPQPYLRNHHVFAAKRVFLQPLQRGRMGKLYQKFVHTNNSYQLHELMIAKLNFTPTVNTSKPTLNNNINTV